MIIVRMFSQTFWWSSNVNLKTCVNFPSILEMISKMLKSRSVTLGDKKAPMGTPTFCLYITLLNSSSLFCSVILSNFRNSFLGWKINPRKITTHVILQLMWSVHIYLWKKLVQTFSSILRNAGNYKYRLLISV